MKGEQRIKILEHLESSAHALSDIFFVFTLPYGTSRSRIEHLLRKRHNHEALEGDPDIQKNRRRFKYVLYRLRKEGLLHESARGGQALFRLTEKGRSMLQKLRQRKKTVASVRYVVEKDDTLKIIIFDIPESDRWKRRWLRSVLRNLKFQMLQKSVWTGKSKIPKEFLDDLERMRLLAHVEIFAISKTGTLKKITDE
ncbi:MAG TPA: hypothetical protein VJC11_03560 [Patescibacteria group bacterium]|nr:hypothetical protein [Patescibacteria group bacterium]